jgi:hypothetical protein
MRSATRTLLAVVLGVGGVAAMVTGMGVVLGRSSPPLADDLVFVTRVIEVDRSAIELAGKDAGADDGLFAQRNLDVLRVALSRADVFDVYPSSRPSEESLVVVRDPIRFGSVSRLLASASIVLVVEPLLSPTQDALVEFQARLVALDEEGSVVGADWEGDALDQLVRLVAWGAMEGMAPGASLEAAVRAVVAPLGDVQESEILAIIDP